MNQYNDYGGGGGFLQGGSPYSTAGSPGGARKETSSCLRPLTVSQLLKASQAHTDAEWTVDDVETGQITIVGQVVTIQSQATNCVYWIDDGTGRIEARHWIDNTSDDDNEKWGGIEELMYVRVTGSLKIFGNKRYINATHIRVVSDPHEVYFHILETITITLKLDKQSGQGQVLAHPGSVTASAYAAQPNAVNDQFSYLPTLQRRIIKFIADQPHSEEGVNIAIIARAIGKEGDAEKISDALEKLMDEGLVYSTIDDSHFNISISTS